MVQNLPLYKRILSYVYPVSIWKGAGTNNPVLELCLYRDQYQLTTDDAIYSDGRRYRPLVLAFNEMKGALASMSRVLVLGTGLGSAVEILNAKNIRPEYTLVDNDRTVLNLAKNYLPSQNKLSFICADAYDFISGSNSQYDLIIVDVFRSRLVPGSVTAKDFLMKCKNSVNTGKYVIMNYIISSANEWDRVATNIKEIFPDNKIIEAGLNRIVIAKA